MTFSVETLARKLETTEFWSWNKRDLNTIFLRCITEWLHSGSRGKWGGFTHLGVTDRSLYNKWKWKELEVMLDILVFKSNEPWSLMMGAEIEWSTRRNPATSQNSDSFFDRIDFVDLNNRDQAIRDRGYDLCKLLLVKPRMMVFLARENKKPDFALEQLEIFAREMTKLTSKKLNKNLLLGVLRKVKYGPHELLINTL